VAVVVVGGLYLAIAATSVLVLGPDLGSSAAPLADLLAVGTGGPVRLLIAVVAVLLTLGAINAYFAGASRLGAALARDDALPGWLTGTPRRSLIVAAVGSVLAVNLPIALHTTMLLVTGCFTLVYILGTAAAIRLLPGRRDRITAGIAFCAVVGLLWLTGPPALLSLVVAAGAIVYQTWRARIVAKSVIPSSISDGSTAPNPNTKPACVVE
jgi:amino acid efflux transporter